MPTDTLWSLPSGCHSDSSIKVAPKTLGKKNLTRIWWPQDAENQAPEKKRCCMWACFVPNTNLGNPGKQIHDVLWVSGFKTSEVAHIPGIPLPNTDLSPNLHIEIREFPKLQTLDLKTLATAATGRKVTLFLLDNPKLQAIEGLDLLRQAAKQLELHISNCPELEKARQRHQQKQEKAWQDFQSQEQQERISLVKQEIKEQEVQVRSSIEQAMQKGYFNIEGKFASTLGKERIDTEESAGRQKTVTERLAALELFKQEQNQEQVVLGLLLEYANQLGTVHTEMWQPEIERWAKAALSALQQEFKELKISWEKIKPNQSITKANIAKHLMLLGQLSQELANTRPEPTPQKIAEAFKIWTKQRQALKHVESRLAYEAQQESVDRLSQPKGTVIQRTTNGAGSMTARSVSPPLHHSDVSPSSLQINGSTTARGVSPTHYSNVLPLPTRANGSATARHRDPKPR